MKRTLEFSAALLLSAAVAALAGCRGDQPPGPQPPAGQPADQVLQILCGGSFQPPVEKLVEMFEAETGHQAELVLGQSEDHLPRVKMEAAGDVFISHDPYMEYTEQAGAMLRWVQVGYVAPVLVVKKGSDLDIHSIEDLTRPGLRVILPNPDYSTCGEMVFKLLEKKGIRDEVLANVGDAQVRSHAQVAQAIKLDHRDAGIMWNGVSHNWLDAIEIVPTPYEYEDEVRVGVMGLSYSEKQELVEEFLEFAEEHGEEVFREFGYVKTPGVEEPTAGTPPSPDLPQPSPEGEAEPSPEAEAEPTPEAEAEPSPEAEAEPSPEAEAEPSPEAEAEPTPEADTPPQTPEQPEPAPAG